MYPQKSTDALAQLNTFRQSRRNPQDYLRESETSLGLPSARQRLMGLRGAISNTENLLRGVDPSVTGRTQGSLVSEAQRQRMVNLEREPIAEQFREQSRALEGETASLSDLSQRSLAQAQLGIEGQREQESSLQNLYTTLFQREQEEEQKRRWQEEFNERRRQAAAQEAAMNAQTAALRNAIQNNMNTPVPVAPNLEQEQAVRVEASKKNWPQYLRRQADEAQKRAQDLRNDPMQKFFREFSPGDVLPAQLKLALGGIRGLFGG